MNKWISALMGWELAASSPVGEILRDEALDAMKKATRFTMDEVSYRGGISTQTYVSNMSKLIQYIIANEK